MADSIQHPQHSSTSSNVYTLFITTEIPNFNHNSSMAYSDQTDKDICFKLKFVSLYCVILFLASLFFNVLLLLTLIIHKDLRIAHNTFIITLCILNVLATLIQLPFVIFSNYYCYWIFGEAGCIIVTKKA